MNKLFSIVIIQLLFALINPAKSQVLISLLLGDKLNTPAIEFGLIGGLNRSYFKDIPTAEGLNNFNLGFYFHIHLVKEAYLSTGVWMKSSVGATGMPTYATGDPSFDALYKDGVLTTKVKYFYVPIMFHQRFNNRWYVEGGTQFGLRKNARDIFDADFQGGEISYSTKTKKDYTTLDAGLIGGLGYKFNQEIKSMSVGVLYYYGLVDIRKDETISIKNSYINAFIKIPVGLKKKE